MVIDIEAKEYTQAEAEALLNYLYRYYYDRPPEEEEANDVSFLQEFGFAGLSALLESIFNSSEMKEKVQNEFNEVWGSYFSHVPETSTRSEWEDALRHARARAREELEKELAPAKDELSRALALIKAHDYAEAQRVLEAIIASGTTDWFFSHYLGYALYQQGKHLQSKYLDAMPHYKEAIERSPDDNWPWSCDDLKGCYEHSGLPDRFERGLEYFKTVIDRFPNRWIAYHECGVMCRHLGSLERLQEAHDYYMKALELCRDPSWGWTASDLRHAFERQGKLDEALPFYLDLTAREPHSENWGAWYARAYVEWKTGNAQGAVGCFERSIELYRHYHNQDGHYWTLNDYGWCLRDLGPERYDEAMDRFQRAKALDPSQWDGWHGIGWVLKMRRDFVKAKTHFEEALRRNPQSAWSWFELGSVYESMASDPLHSIYAWEAYERTLVDGAFDESAYVTAREAKVQLEEEGKPGVHLRNFIEQRYSLKEVQDLCFQLNIDHENLEAQSKPSLIRELVKFCQRRVGKTLALIQQLHKERPDEFPPLVSAPGNRR